MGGGGPAWDDIDSQDINGAMILKMNMAFGNKKIMEALLAAGAEVDSKDGNGRMVVSYAAASGRPELAKVLLGAGVDVDVDAVDYARNDGHESLVQLLLEHREKQCAAVGGDGESEVRETELMNDSAIGTGDESLIISPVQGMGWMVQAWPLIVGLEIPMLMMSEGVCKRDFLLYSFLWLSVLVLSKRSSIRLKMALVQRAQGLKQCG